MYFKLLVSAVFIFFLPMNVYSRALRHIDMNDVKRKHQEKLIEKKIAEEKKIEEGKYISYMMEKKKYNWREKLSEGMTTDGMFATTLDATGDATIVSGQDLRYGPDSPEPELYYGVGAGDFYDTRYVDTVVFTVTAGVGPLTVYMDGTNATNISGGSGTYSIPIPPNLRGKSVNISWTTAIPYETTGYGNWRISNIRLQRRAPMNVFVPLDSPEATSFIRTDPAFAGLSEEEKKKKLQEMLQASDEYTEMMFGDDFPGSGAVPPGEAGDTPGVEVTDYGQIAQVSEYPSGSGSQPKYQTPSGGPGTTDDRNKNMRYDPHMKMMVPNIGPGYSSTGVLSV